MLPYLLTPRWARFTQRSMFLARYLLIGSAGLVALNEGTFSLAVIGWTLLLGSAIALHGVVTGRFHLELVPIWFILAALSWAAGLLFVTDRFASGVLILALLPGLAERLLHLSLVASSMRRLPGKREHGVD